MNFLAMREGKIELLEYHLFEQGDYQNYMDFLDRARKIHDDQSVSNLRYFISLAHAFNDSGGQDQYMFIGGAGVLGNMLRHMDESRVIECRGLHDIDLVLRARPYEYVLTDFFDQLNANRSSLSIPGKMVVSGRSLDFYGNELKELSMDVYRPNGHPIREGAVINGVHFNQAEWEKRKLSSLFGVPFNVANPLTLLNLKLNITTGNKSSRRSKDCKDLVNLLGVLEKDGVSSEEVRDSLNFTEYGKMKEIFSKQCTHCETCCMYQGYNLPPSEDYINGILMEVEDENIVSV